MAWLMINEYEYEVLTLKTKYLDHACHCSETPSSKKFCLIAPPKVTFSNKTAF